MLVVHQYIMYDIIVFEEARVFKNFHSGERFWWPKTPFTCQRKAKMEKKISIFKIIWVRIK